MRIALVALALAGTAAAAQQPGVPAPGAGQAAGPENVRVNQLFVYGNDPCPQSEDLHEVTICVVLSEDDRFRVPPNLRHNPNDPASQAWEGRAIELSYVGRTGTESCSTVAAAASPAASTRSSARRVPSAPAPTKSIGRG